MFYIMKGHSFEFNTHYYKINFKSFKRFQKQMKTF